MGQVKVRSYSKNLTFSSMDFEILSWASLVIKTVRIVKNTSLECYRNVWFEQRLVKQSSGSMSGHRGKVILPNNISLHSHHATRVLEVVVGV